MIVLIKTMLFIAKVRFRYTVALANSTTVGCRNQALELRTSDPSAVASLAGASRCLCFKGCLVFNFMFVLCFEGEKEKKREILYNKNFFTIKNQDFVIILLLMKAKFM